MWQHNGNKHLFLRCSRVFCLFPLTSEPLSEMTPVWRCKVALVKNWSRARLELAFYLTHLPLAATLSTFLCLHLSIFAAAPTVATVTGRKCGKTGDLRLAGATGDNGWWPIIEVTWSIGLLKLHGERRGEKSCCLDSAFSAEARHDAWWYNWVSIHFLMLHTVSPFMYTVHCQ